MAITPTYTDTDTANDYLDIDPDSPTAVTAAEILVAEDDIDDLGLGNQRVGNYEASAEQTAPYRRVNVTTLHPRLRYQLSRATCEQVKYRRTMGKAFFDEPQRDGAVVIGGSAGIQYESTLPLLAPRALQILQRLGWTNRLGSTRVSRHRGWMSDDDYTWERIY